MRIAIVWLFLGALSSVAFGASIPLPTITHYEMKMRIMPDEERISCACRLIITNTTQKPHTRIDLLLNRGFAVTEDRFFVDNETNEYREKAMGMDWYGGIQVNRITFRLPQPLEPGESTTIQMNYYGPLLDYTSALTYLRDSVNESYTLLREETFAYPMLTSFAIEDAWGEKPPFTFDVEITVPTGHVVAGSGERIKGVHNEESATFRFRSESPTTRMAFAMARFNVTSNEENGFTVYALPEHKEFVQKTLDIMSSAVEFYTELFGAPSRKHGLTAIDIPKGWGSQVGDAYFLQPLSRFAETTDIRSAYRHIARAWTVEAHPDVQASRWFDVSFATYFGALAMRKIEGADAFTDFLAQSARAFVQRVESSEDIGRTPIAKYNTPRFARNSRTKGVLALYVLHELVGDRTFRKIVSTLIAEHSIAPAGFEDFQRISERISGLDLKKYFAEWIYGTESSDLLVRQMKWDEIVARYR